MDLNTNIFYIKHLILQEKHLIVKRNRRIRQTSACNLASKRKSGTNCEACSQGIGLFGCKDPSFKPPDKSFFLAVLFFCRFSGVARAPRFFGVALVQRFAGVALERRFSGVALEQRLRF